VTTRRHRPLPVNDKVGFEVNIGAEKVAGIKLRSKLLRLAKIV